jgi:hypothetical protein
VNIDSNIPKAIATNKAVEVMNVHFKDKALKRRIIECEIEEGVSLYDRERTITLTASSKEKEKIDFYKDLEEYQQTKTAAKWRMRDN